MIYSELPFTLIKFYNYNPLSQQMFEFEMINSNSKTDQKKPVIVILVFEEKKNSGSRLG